MEEASPRRLVTSDAVDTEGYVIESGLEMDTLEEFVVCCICTYDGGCRKPTKCEPKKTASCILKWTGKVIVWPLKKMFKYTCPPCELETKYERLYPLTFLTSFLWVALWSFLISTIVELWVDGLIEMDGIESVFGKNAKQTLMPISGVVLIAIGAE